MAGRRRSRIQALVDPMEPRPRLRETRAQRRRAQLAREYGAARTPMERLAVAFDYFRGAAAGGRADHAAAAQAADEIARHLLAAADRLLERQAK